MSAWNEIGSAPRGSNRIEEMTPKAYRIVRIDGELTLQGLFTWTETGHGTPSHDSEWRTIPTMDLPPPPVGGGEG